MRRRVSRPQFICTQCGTYPTERLEWMERKRNYTSRYEEYIYERVKELTVEQVSRTEQLSPEQVQNIFSRKASQKKASASYIVRRTDNVRRTQDRLINARKIELR